jgi:receptor-binding and translocation channel-forming TcA subunit of Tc toxin
MATAISFRVVVSRPAGGAIVGRTAVVVGTCVGEVPRFVVAEVRVTFGGGAESTAPLNRRSWTCEVTAPATAPAGASVTIVAQAYGMEEGDSTLVPVGPVKKVTVVLDGAVPDLLTIDSFPTPVTTQPGQAHVLDLAGTAGDANSGISKVELKIDEGPYVAVDELVETVDTTGHRIWRWRKKSVSVFADVQSDHRFTVRAVDGLGNSIERSRDIEVRVPFEPGPVEQVFGPTRYLAEQLAFAVRYVQVAGATGKLTAKMLADRFHQPFDRLSDATLFEDVTAPLPQSRIADEVLRSHLTTTPPGRTFRNLAYQTFLRALGTSYDELRLARDGDTRAKLAERLGIDPARIDQLTIPPDTITDRQLEMLFGYRSAIAGDPLRPATGTAQVLLWKRDTLRARWQDEDSAHRGSPDDPLPIVEPDLVPESHFRTRTPDDPAYALWTGRTKWLADKLAEIKASHADAAELARFDALLAAFVGAFDPSLAALGEQDANGADVRPDLPQGLEVDAFRFLVRSRALLVERTPLESGWDDVVEILLQVQKRRQYQPWRTEENRASLVLEPAFFIDDATPPAGVSRWRFRRAGYAEWRRTLAARTAGAAALDTAYERIAGATEATVLPQLRDALVARLADQDAPDEAADRLTRELLIDLRTEGGRRTTRVGQALETLHSMLFGARNGTLRPDAAGRAWTIKIEPTHAQDRDGQTRLVLEFDREWAWRGTFAGWLAATRVFAYPENQLFPAVYRTDRAGQPPTTAYTALIKELRTARRISPDDAQELADVYVKYLREHGIVGDTFPPFTNQLTDAQLLTLREHSQALENLGSRFGREVFWLAPMAIGAKLQESGQFQAALDWYKRIYAFTLPTGNRKIYVGLVAEDKPSTYVRETEWLLGEVDPHDFALDRRNCYTKATIMAIAGCFSAFADDEFGRGTADGNARARTLYEIAIDLLGLPEFTPEDDEPFPPNPVHESMRDHARTGLTKVHCGLNIAGVATTYESVLPSQYRYGVLVERARSLVSTAQQVEASYLSALEQRDAKAYDELRARNDLEAAGATVGIHTTRLAEAVTGVRTAELQRQRAQLQEDHFTHLIDDGYSAWEQTALLALGAAAAFHTASVVAFGSGGIISSAKMVLSFGLLGNPGNDFGQMLSAAASAAATGAQIAQAVASHERQVQEWQLQKDLAAKDGEIADKQVQAAELQVELAGQERQLAVLQQDHALAVATFLATRFTNAELFEWMSGVLGRVYAFFLQQATALAQLAEAQLAFERQELPAGFIGTDYWRDATAGADAPDRRGLTGSARLLEDVTRLDQYAFDTDRRKLHLTQTFPLSQLAAFELQEFRDTGVLTFATPEVLFDREFPGHFLRLIKRVKVSLVALLPPVRGVRATLTASGVSRTVVARGPFDVVTLRRDPEAIAFTSAVNASGLFDLEPESGLLLPFEGMGVDTVWQLELPKAANPFDFRMIADVLLTVEYTALASAEYRERVVRELDRRFTGDRTFSVRNQYPDVWYELNNPDTAEHRMRAVLPMTADDFPPHIRELHVEQISLFVVRADTLTDELTVLSLSHTTARQTVTSAEVTTTGGIISTRRPAGVAWNVHLGADPTGTWALQLPDDEVVRSWFHDELVEDLVLVLTLGGTTSEWP